MIIELHRRCAERFTQVVDGIGDDDWHRPAPCTEWDVTALLDHNVGENLWAPPILDGRTIEELGDRFEHDVLGDDPKRAWRASADAACAAAENLGDLRAVVHLSFGDLPAEEYLWQRHADFVVHAWDLARGVGVDDHLGDDLVEPCLAWAEPYAEIFASMPDYFDPPITPAPGDASTTPEPAGPAGPLATDPDWAGGAVVEDVRQISCDAAPADVFATVAAIGGDRGWYGFEWLWTLRGLLDLVVGGVGPPRGRRHPQELRVGDAVDWFRVEVVGSPGLLRLRAEMRMPGQGWIEWSVVAEGTGARLSQRVRYHPHGLLGRLYWWILIPAHAVVFTRMLRSIKAVAEERQRYCRPARPR